MAYATLGQLAPFILEHQSKGTIAAATVNKQNPEMRVKLGGYTLNVSLQRDPRTYNVVPDLTGYGIFMLEGPGEYLMAGNNIQVGLHAHTPGPPIAGLAWQESGVFENGKWVRNHILGGDDSVLRYDMVHGRGHEPIRQRRAPHAGERGIQKVKVSGIDRGASYRKRSVVVSRGISVRSGWRDRLYTVGKHELMQCRRYDVSAWRLHS